MQKEFLNKETEIPEVVQNKLDAAFSSIKMEGAEMKTKKKSFFKRPAAIIAVAAVVVLAAGTAFAAANGFWSNGMSGILPEDTASQQELESQGYVTHLDENYDAVTIDGVTITPADVICDGTYGHIVFSVEGFEIKDGEEPAVCGISIYTGNDSMARENYISATSRFYPGYTVAITEDGYGNNDYYDNGDPMEWKDEEHLLCMPRYYDENGNMEYVISFHSSLEEESLIGQTVHISFEGLGVSSGKAEVTETVNGEWTFDITLPGNDDTRIVSVGQKLDGTDYILDTVEISPLSVKTYFTYDGTDAGKNNPNEIPMSTELFLADGSYWIPTGGGAMGFTDETRTNAVEYEGFGKVLDASSVTSIMFSCNPYPGESSVTVIELD